MEIEDLPIDQGLEEDDQEMVEAGPDPEADAQHLQNAQQVIDGCRERIQQSLQPIDQILEHLLTLYQMRDNIEKQTEGAFDFWLDKSNESKSKNLKVIYWMNLNISRESVRF